ncbi:Putative tRNA (Guanine-N1)-methyltransferase [Rhizopus microsporus]|nr:Putative tRNA (Guanine-N1)-methyltransferase [Rhizopus microsporus]
MSSEKSKDQTKETIDQTNEISQVKQEEKQETNKGNIRVFCGREYDITDPKFAGKSKNAIKKLLRDEIWEETKRERSRRKKEKEKSRKRERKKLVEEGVLEPLPKKSRAKDITVGNVGLILDCSFSSYMIHKEISSLRGQIGRSYSANVRAKKESMKMTLTSVDDALCKEMDDKSISWRNWRNVELTPKSYLDIFNKEDLIYLTADSDNVVHELEEGKNYIVGAIVDKNRYKNLCKNKADEQGIKTARLPIGDYLKISSRKVLTVNHVVEIMIKWLDCRNWEQAFLEVIPERKLKDVELVNHQSEDDNEEESDDYEEEDLSTENKDTCKSTV